MNEPNRLCPKCSENGHDSNGDHLFLMTDGSRWCCNKVQYHGDGQYYFEKIGEEKEEPQPLPAVHILKTTEESSESVPVESSGGTMSMDELFSTEPSEALYEPPVGIADLPCVDFRGIPQRFYEKYGVKQELSETDRSVVKVFYPMFEGKEQTAWKVREVKEKKFFKVPVS